MRLAGELVAGFLDGLAQRGVAGQQVGGDADGARGDVDVDAGDAGDLADLGPDGAGAVVAGHSGNRYGASGHTRHGNARGRLTPTSCSTWSTVGPRPRAQTSSSGR